MTYVCNDQLTRIGKPEFGPDWATPKTYRVGDRGEKHGHPYIIRAFGVSPNHNGKPPLVWMIAKWKGNRDWIEMLIGREDCFREKLVRGVHRNKVFRY